MLYVCIHSAPALLCNKYHAEFAAFDSSVALANHVMINCRLEVKEGLIVDFTFCAVLLKLESLNNHFLIQML